MRVLALLLLAFVALASAQGWAGTWKTNYGDPSGNAPFYICVVGTKFYGTYSNIGTLR